LRRNFYGRFKGPSLSKGQETLLKVDLLKVLINSVDIIDNPKRKQLNLKKYKGMRPLWLEIGFGSGEHLINQAMCNPNVIFFGCEPYKNGVASLLGKLKEKPVNNIFLYPGDVRNLFDVLPNSSIDRVFLLYPDPWPKKRHNRRRFVNPEYLLPLFRVMKESSQFRIATDITEYYRHALEEVLKFDFTLSKQNGLNFDLPWKDWVPTRYEEKAKKENRTSYYLTFKKIGV
tara:strand:- start:128 stop:817 length:690 start_codon:yes stop_codon:yes gene_type:complete